MNRFVISLTLLVFSGCGAKSDTRKDSSVGNETVDIDCYYETCSSDKQFCIKSRHVNREDLILTAECTEKPSGKFDCEKAEELGYSRFSNSNNCSAGINCKDSNGAITVTCLSPGI
jgi:hypothetical protein